MIVKDLYVEDLHGYITGITHLKRDFSILFGKNGSGKTTALNIIRAVLNFDAKYISSLEFSKIVINYHLDNEDGQISLEKNKNNTTISINNESAPLSLVRLSEQEDSRREDYIIKLWESESRKSSKLKKDLESYISITKTIEKIKSKSNITLVNIDRTIQVAASGSEVVSDTTILLSKSFLIEKSPKTPLDVVQDYCQKSHASYLKQLAAIRSSFINGLMVKFLDISIEDQKLKDSRITELDIEKLEKRLKELDIYKDPGSEMILVKFFSETRKILSTPKDTKKSLGRKTLKEERERIIKNISITRIEGLLKSIEEMDKEIKECSERTNKYLEVINSFFNGSGKEVYFSNTDNKIYFKFTKSHSNNENGRSISELSSGERQVIIVLTYLYFVAQKDSIFIIDEPELSLHLTWQKNFVSAMKELAPDDCQIILASHSPEIVGPHREMVERVFGSTKEI